MDDVVIVVACSTPWDRIFAAAMRYNMAFFSNDLVFVFLMCMSVCGAQSSTLLLVFEIVKLTASSHQFQIRLLFFIG